MKKVKALYNSALFIGGATLIAVAIYVMSIHHEIRRQWHKL